MPAGDQPVPDLEQVVVGDGGSADLELGRVAVGGGQVEDDRVRRSGLQDLHHRLAHLDAEIEFGGRKAFGAVLEPPVGIGKPRGIVAQLLRAVDRDRLDVILVHVK